MSVRSTAMLLAAALAVTAAAGRSGAQEDPAGRRDAGEDAGPVADAGAPPPREAPLPEGLPEIPPGRELALQEAIELAVERNLSLAESRLEVEKAQADLHASWAALFPVAKGSMTLTHKDHEDTANLGGNRMVIGRQDSLNGVVDVAVPLMNPGAWLGVRAGEAGAELAELRSADARQALLLTVAQAYYQVLTARAVIEVHESQLRSASRHLEIARTRLVSGIGRRVDINRARADALRSEESLIAAHTSLVDSRDALGVLTGIGGLPTAADAPELEAPEAGERELIDAAERNRSDLEAERAALDLAEARLDASWMQLLPSLDASWQLTHRFTSANAFSSSDRTRWNVYLVLSVPIYSQTRYADLDRSRAEVRRAEIASENARRNAALEVRRARRGYLTAVKKTAVAAEQAEIARETLQLTEAEWIAGTGSSLAVTDAARALREAETNLATRRFEAQLALLELLRAAGRDMRNLGG